MGKRLEQQPMYPHYTYYYPHYLQTKVGQSARLTYFTPLPQRLCISDACLCFISSSQKNHPATQPLTLYLLYLLPFWQDKIYCLLPSLRLTHLTPFAKTGFQSLYVPCPPSERGDIDVTQLDFFFSIPSERLTLSTPL